MVGERRWLEMKPGTLVSRLGLVESRQKGWPVDKEPGMGE